MSEEFEKLLDFDSDTFEDMKHDMNFVLQRLIGNMQEKGTNEGSMALKIDVTMVNEFIPNYDPDIEGETRKISKPQFKHKVTSAVKINDEKSGTFNNEMELVMDDETGVFKLVPIANTVQRSIFDSDFQKSNDKCVNDEEGEDGQNLNEGTCTPLLPGPEEKSEDSETPRKCITGWSKYDVCSCCGKDGVQCCSQCEESCNSRCGWIKEPYDSKDEDREETEPGEGLEDITDELLGETEEPENEEDDGYSYEEPEDDPEE